MTSHASLPRCATGIAGLDHIVRGGLAQHRLYLVQGDPGVGKTTLALQFLLEGANRGESCLYVTLSETREELEEVASSHGWSLDQIHILELSSFADQLTMDAQNTLFHPAEVELRDVTKIIFEEVERRQPTRAVIDSLSELRLLSQEGLRYRRQLLGIKQFFIGRHCTTLCLDDLSSNDRKEDRQLESLCHGVIALRRDEPPYGTERRQILVRKLRGSRFHGGYHDYIIDTGGLVVFPRVIASGHHREFRRESSSAGVSGVDAILGGGLDRGTSNLIMGPPGTGKSSLALTFAHAAAQRGEKVSLFVFDENLALYLAKSKTFGNDLQPLIARGLVEARQVDPSELSPGHFAHLVTRAVETGGTRLVIIDSLNGYSKSMQAGEVLGLQLHELLSYLGQQGIITVLVLSQRGFIDEMPSEVDVTYLADTVIILRFFETAGSVRQAISVAKKRSGSHERTIREFRVGGTGVSVGEPLRQFEGVLTGAPRYLGGVLPANDESAPQFPPQPHERESV